MLLHERAYAGTQLEHLGCRAQIGDGHGVSIAGVSHAFQVS
jgi:hypothetical protein